MSEQFKKKWALSEGKLSTPTLAGIIFAIFLLTFAAYGNTLSNGFVHDDEYQVLNNPWIRDFANLPAVFSQDVWAFNKGIGVSNYYRPLMHVVYMLIYQVVGLNAWGYHLVNILAHAGISILVLLTGMELFKRYAPRESPRYIYLPVIAAVLFAVHPIHTEAVSWVAGIPDLGYSFFYLLSFYFYIKVSDDWESLQKRYLFLSVLSFFLATLFKETALTLILIILAYDFVCSNSRFSAKELFKRYTPYAVVIITYFVMRFNAISDMVSVNVYRDLSFYELFINCFHIFTKYIFLLILPINLSFVHEVDLYTSAFEPIVLFSMAITLVICLFMAVAARKFKLVFLSFVFFLVPLLPAFLLRALPYPLAERYLYLPSFGFLLLISALLIHTVDKRRGQRMLTVAGLAVAIVFTVVTIGRNADWKDSYTLWADTVAKAPNTASAHFNLGATLKARGRIEEAIAHYEIAVRLESIPWMHRALGSSYADLGLSDKAIEQYLTALQLEPNDAKTHNDLGSVYGETGRLDQAIKHFRTAVELEPDNALHHNNLGMAWMYEGSLDLAIDQFEAAVRLDPETPAYRQRLSEALSLRADARNDTSPLR